MSCCSNTVIIYINDSNVIFCSIIHNTSNVNKSQIKTQSGDLVLVEVEVVVLLGSPGIQSLSLKTFDLLPLKKSQLTD